VASFVSILVLLSLQCLAPYLLVFSFFFFQAEDGIRDFHVTGVQTCALPICPRPSTPAPSARRSWTRTACGAPSSWDATASGSARSEERRVGKECRSRRSRCREKETGGRAGCGGP